MESRLINKVIVTSDDPDIMDICTKSNTAFIDRPKSLASSTAKIDDAMRHCIEEVKKTDGYKTDIVVLLYANVPVRATGIIDKAIEHLIKNKCDSVQTMIDPGKFHPYWLYKLNNDKASKYIDNNIYRRQELPEVFAIDGAVGVVKCSCLMDAAGNSDPHAFWGTDRRGIIQEAHETVDIDCLKDFFLAEAILKEQMHNNTGDNTK